MPRFFFNVFDGADWRDQEGTDLPDWKEAREEAVRLAGRILRDDAKRFALTEDWRMEVTDEKGVILFRLDFSVMETPATMGSRPVSGGS